MFFVKIQAIRGVIPKTMQQKEVFHRGEEIGHEARKLPAPTYNTIRLLFDYSDSSSIFLPIRSMQYMAVIDHEEVIFVDGLKAKKIIELAWQEFKPQERDNLTDPVSYHFSYYNEKAIETMKRLQWEFDKALHLQYDRLKEKLPLEDAKIIKLVPTKSNNPKDK
jgi:hypothetical protein